MAASQNLLKLNFDYGTTDNNGNLTTKTDARGVQTSYVYDALNRVTQRNYSTPNGAPPNYQTTPNVTYFYDGSNQSGGIANSKGKLTKVANGVSTTEYTSFDILGRVQAQRQTTDGKAYDTGYAYNLSGALMEESYPSGRVVKNTLDNDGDLMQVQSQRSGGVMQNHANAFTYTAAGAVSAMRLGNGRWENTVFNSRLQPVQIGLGSSATSQNVLKLNFDYGQSDNNGNVKSQTITVNRSNQTPLTFTQNYMYDSLNRISSAEEKDEMNATVWRQVFAFDRYGNRNFVTGSNATTTLGTALLKVVNPEILQSDNRLKQDQDADGIAEYLYDGAGNLTKDAENKRFAYDAENKQTKFFAPANQTNDPSAIYSFDGDGHRVKKQVGSEITIFVYDANSKLVAEYSTTVASAQDAKTNYTTNDHLGSPRITTDGLGNVVSRTDYMPYGEEIFSTNRTSTLGYTVQDTVNQGFTGYYNDGESGLEYAQARMYWNRMGRFTSADPENAGAMENAPDSWNGYVYTGNNPLSFTDPSGLWKRADCGAEECWESDRADDTPESLAEIAGYNLALLRMFFEHNDTFVPGEGHVFNFGSFDSWLDERFDGAVENVQESDIHVKPTVEPYIPIPGWKFVKGRKVGNKIKRVAKKIWNSVSRARSKLPSAAQRVPNLNDLNRAAAEKELLKGGFSYQGKTQGGYDKWYHSDGSKILVRPNGEVVRTPNSNAITQSGNSGKGWRIDPETGEVARAHTYAQEFIQ